MVVVGFNHNFRYRGEIFHVQTEDSGRKKPFVVTLLYKGGTILASKKTSYADILKIDHLERVVEELMKDQHREMLRRLKAGEFDSTIETLFFSNRSAEAPRQPAGQDPRAAPVRVSKPLPESLEEAPSAPPERLEEKPSSPSPSVAPKREKVVETSLDEIILSYLAGEENDHEAN